MIYYVRSSDGADYRVGLWKGTAGLGGVFVPGTRSDAIRELHLLREPGTYVWGKSTP